MSEFTSRADQLLNEFNKKSPANMAKAGMQGSKAMADQAELDKKIDPTKKIDPDLKTVSRLAKQMAKKAALKMKQQMTAMTKASTEVKGKVIEQDVAPVPPPGGDPAAAAPPAGAPAAAAPAGGEEQPAAKPLSIEGEVMLVELARNALHFDLKQYTKRKSLTEEERGAITNDVLPETAMAVADIFRTMIREFGLNPESYDSRIDPLIEDLKKNDRVVVLVPGSFKPPHKGHYEMVKQYSETYPQGQVHVLISAPSPKSERRTKDGKLITPADAKQIFELYIVGNQRPPLPIVQPLNNVTVSVSEFPSPVTAAYESLKTLPPGTTVVLGASRKDDDWKRWSYAQSWAEKEELGLNIIDPAESAVDVTVNAIGRPYSADNIRKNFDNFEAIKPDIPAHVDSRKIEKIFNSL